MKNAIEKLISVAENIEDVDTQFEILESVEDIISELADTINCPSNWRSIGEELAEKYKDNSFIYNNLKLWEHEDW